MKKIQRAGVSIPALRPLLFIIPTMGFLRDELIAQVGTSKQCISQHAHFRTTTSRSPSRDCWFSIEETQLEPSCHRMLHASQAASRCGIDTIGSHPAYEGVHTDTGQQ